MRIAVIGDIHANHIALERCLEWIYSHDIDGMIFLGDYVTDCPYPMKTIELLRNLPSKYKTWFIKGNREDYLLKYRKEPIGWQYGSKTGSLLYTYESLTSEALDWLESMPDKLDIHIEGSGTISAVHHPPYYEYLQKEPPSEKLQQTIADMTTDVLLCAHSHVPVVYEQNKRLIVNSGPLGMPNQMITDLSFAVLEHTDRWRAEIVRLPYDRDAVCAEFEQSGIIDKAHFWALGVREIIRTGYEYSVECLDELYRVLQQNPGKTEFDEDMWEIAAKNIGLI